MKVLVAFSTFSQLSRDKWKPIRRLVVHSAARAASQRHRQPRVTHWWAHVHYVSVSLERESSCTASKLAGQVCLAWLSELSRSCVYMSRVVRKTATLRRDGKTSVSLSYRTLDRLVSRWLSIWTLPLVSFHVKQYVICASRESQGCGSFVSASDKYRVQRRPSPANSPLLFEEDDNEPADLIGLPASVGPSQQPATCRLTPMARWRPDELSTNVNISSSRVIRSGRQFHFRDD